MATLTQSSFFLIMVTEFDLATFFQNATMFKACVEAGCDHSALDSFRRTPMFGLRHCSGASTKEFVAVLQAFIDAGADINHVDSFGNTLLLMCENDELGAALVQVGADISYDFQDWSKRGLANAAVFGCTRTIDAMVLSRKGRPDEIQQRDFDSCFDRAAKTMTFNPDMKDMTGIIKLAVDYGANPNTWSTLHYCARSNPVLVRTLVSLGARADTLAWDFSRGVKNTPLHRITGMDTIDVFEALVQPNTDFNVRDGSGATPLMALMKNLSLLHSDDVIRTRMNWLVNRGASFLNVDNLGKRVTSMIRSKHPPFKDFIASRIRDENWRKRRWIVFLRHRFLRGIGNKRTKFDHPPPLVERVFGFQIEGVYRHIVTYL